MTQLKGQGVLARKESKPVADGKFTNYSYEIIVSASKAGKDGVVATTGIKLLANKDMGGEVGNNVDFTAELVPFKKKDGTGTSHFFKALSMNFSARVNSPVSNDFDDTIPF